MPRLLLIAHAPLASALRAVAQHTYPDCAPILSALDVTPEMTLDDVEAGARACMAARHPDEWLLLVDTPGATPSNAALRLVGPGVQVVSGVNVPMLWRCLCYASQKTLPELASRAAQGGINGITPSPEPPSPA
jgi:mannose PTS system EIIA component